MDITDEITSLKQSRNAVILAHNYQVGEVQDVADYVGDSLGLSRQAAATDADVIIFCGVHFMAETAAILSPSKLVLLPDLDAGCSLAESIEAKDVRRWKDEHPHGAVVSYVNTSAAVKAESDYCCTSANAVQVVQAIPEDQEILFVPDMFLGNHVRRVTGRKNMTIWMGECHVHAAMRPSDITLAKEEHPDAELMVHPECGCTTPAMYYQSSGEEAMQGVRILSTGGMLHHAQTSPNTEFVVATETGILHALKKQSPEKRFYALAESMVCRYMKMITLEKVRDSLRDDVHRIEVPADIAQRARLPIERMVAIT
jgi:quinolinate synthase